VTLVVAAACSSSGSSSAGNPQAPQSGSGATTPVSVVTGFTYVGAYAPLYYGIANGTYKAHNINLSVKSEAGGTITAGEEVAQGKIDFGFIDTSAASTLIAKGAGLTVLATYQPVDDMAVLTLSQSGIKTAKDLIGKSIATSPTGSLGALLPAFLKAAGVSNSQVKMVNVSGQQLQTSVITHQTEAAVGYAWGQTVTIEAATHQPVTAILYSSAGVDITGYGLIVNSSYLKAHPDVARQMVAATSTAVEASVKDPTAANDAGVAANPALAKDSDLSLKELQIFAKEVDDQRTPGKPLGWNDPATWTKSLNIINKYMGPIPTDGSKYYTNAYLPAS